MKPSKKTVMIQRRLIDKKLRPWLALQSEARPPMGWIKAVRGALGISSRQLANIMGTDSSSIIRLEERETLNKVSLELIDRAAQAMGCKLIYAIVPKEVYPNLESIVDEQAHKLAANLVMSVEHTMQLEEQGAYENKEQIEKLAQSFKENVDPRIWGLPKHRKTNKGKKEK